MSTAYNSGIAPPQRTVDFGWISESFRLFGQAAGPWVVAVLVYGIAINVVVAILRNVLPNPDYVPPVFGGRGVTYSNYIGYGTNSPFSPAGQVLNLLLSWLIGSFQSASLYRMAVKQVRGQAVSLGDMFGGGPVLAGMLVYALLYGLSLVLGIAALCIGLFVVAGLLLPGYALVADGAKAGDAFSRSLGAMKGQWLQATLFTLAFFLLLVVSALPCGLGLLVTVPMAYLVSALAYRDMLGMPDMQAPAGPDYGAAQPGVWPPPPSVTPPQSWPPAPSTPGGT